MRVLAHPGLKNYLIKIYPLNEKTNTHRQMTWAVKRCIGAENIQKLITEKNLQHFSVPNKWIYFAPNKEGLVALGIKNYVALLVEDMKLVTKKESRAAWANIGSPEIIKELYVILSRGYSSCYLP